MTLLVSALLGVISLFIYLFFPAQLERAAFEAIAEKAQTVAEMSTYTLGPALDFKNFDEVEEILQAAFQLENVSFARVETPEGLPIETIVRDSSQASPRLISLGENGVSSDGRLYLVHHPITWNGEVLGTLHMGFSLDALNRNLAHSRLVFAGVSLLVFVIGILASLLISTFITGPLRLIVETTESIAGGDLSRRAPILTHDEVGLLASSFNGMIESLDRTNRFLRDSEQRFRAVIEHTSDMILVLDRNLRITYVSPICEAILGHPATMLTGKRVLEMLHPKDRRRVLRLVARERSGNSEDIITFEGRVHHIDGGWRNLSFRARTLIDLPGINGILVNARDVTANKKFERELVVAKIQAEEMVHLKDAFLTNMSHEIRTPLTGILGFAQILLSEIGDDYRPLVASIEQSGQRLLHTLNSVLDLAQLEAESVRLNLMPLNVYEETHTALRLLQPLAAKKGISLDVATREEAPVANLDRTYFNRILNNLVGNAIKFTEHGGVRVLLSREGERLRIDVQDTGVGIDEAFLPHIFSEFKQESSGLEREYEGNGLGLTITKRLVELMQGTIHVKSIKGVGSVFTLYFPYLEPPSEAPDPQHSPKRMERKSRPPSAQRNRRRSLLAVDDNPDVRILLNRWLAPDLSVTTVGDSMTAMEKAREHFFDVVLMDISLCEDRDGISVMREMRNLPGFSNTRFVALTAFALPGDRERFLRKGFDAYLSKPFTHEDLTSVIGNIFEKQPQTPSSPPAT